MIFQSNKNLFAIYVLRFNSFRYMHFVKYSCVFGGHLVFVDINKCWNIGHQELQNWLNGILFFFLFFQPWGQ